MNRPELERRLEDAGRRQVPGPRPEFTSALGARLRTIQATTAAPARTGEGATPRARLRWVGAAATLLLVAALALLTRPGEPQVLEIVFAEDAVVVHADGTVEDARPGMRVADGSEVRTGPAGRVVLERPADGQRARERSELGPGETAVVRGGRLEPVTPAPRPPPTTGTDRPGTATPRPTPSPTPDARPSPTPDARPSPTPDARPSPTPDARPSPSPQAAPSPDARPSPHPTPSPLPESTLRLAVTREDGAATLSWSGYDGERFHAYVVLRADHPDEPAYPPHRATTVLARIGERTTLGFRDQPTGGSSPVYRVVAVDADGRELARSPAVAP